MREMFDVVRIMQSFVHSFRGLWDAIVNEVPFQQEVALTVVLVPVALWLGQDGVERALLVGSLFVVLVSELMNSAIESAVDRVGLERHELSRKAKDFGSAAVTLAIVMAIVVWALVLLG